MQEEVATLSEPEEGDVVFHWLLARRPERAVDHHA
jgi:hypothetical protein